MESAPQFSPLETGIDPAILRQPLLERREIRRGRGGGTGSRT